MELKGAYNSGTSYNVGDVVTFNGAVYHLQKPADAGTEPVNTLHWGRLDQELAEAVKLIMDASAMAQNELDKFFIDDKTIVLGSSTESSNKRFAITVDDEGELDASEITEG